MSGTKVPLPNDLTLNLVTFASPPPSSPIASAVFTPMDFFNPFDPATVDKKYKAGDDMLYGQYLQASGNDLQVVWVIRRDGTGDLTLTRTAASALAAGKNVTSLVTSLSYSWLGWGHNFSGLIEYFYNGFGQSNGDYSPAALASNPELVERVVHGRYSIWRY